MLLYIGIKIVNKNIVYLGYLDNPNIFNIDIGEGSLELFGKNYIIDLKILKKEALKKRPDFPGLLFYI